MLVTFIIFNILVDKFYISYKYPISSIKADNVAYMVLQLKNTLLSTKCYQGIVSLLQIDLSVA